jgi:hypothetical protein
MTDSNGKSPDPRGTASTQAAGGNRLAHWPPPTFRDELKPMAIKHRTNAPIKHATRRGWRMTRSMFAEFEGDDD